MWFCHKINAKIPFLKHDVYSVAIYTRFIDVLSFDDADHYTRIFFSQRQIAYGSNIKENLNTSCIHAEMCVRSMFFLSFFFFLFLTVCIFQCRLIVFFLFLFLLESISLCHCCSLTKFQYVLNHDACSIFRNTHIYTQQTPCKLLWFVPGHGFSCVSGIVCVCVCVYMYMRNGNPRIFYRQNIDSTGSFS